MCLRGPLRHTRGGQERAPDPVARGSTPRMGCQLDLETCRSSTSTSLSNPAVPGPKLRRGNPKGPCWHRWRNRQHVWETISAGCKPALTFM